nr:NUDIX domain-containing protein [uncultured Cetobacterium sp.]
MHRIDFYNLHMVEDEKLEFAVILAEYKGKFLLVKHRDRDTWEIPGGHRDMGEKINDTADRELKEETGAKQFKIEAICEYSVTLEEQTRYGRLFYVNIEVLGELPDSEIEKIDFFEELPENLTYPTIQPKLVQEVLLRKG